MAEEFTINGDKHPIPIAVTFGDGIALHAANAALDREEALALAKWITQAMEENEPIETSKADDCASLAYDALSHANTASSTDNKAARAAVGQGYAILASYYQGQDALAVATKAMQAREGDLALAREALSAAQKVGKGEEG